MNGILLQLHVSNLIQFFDINSSFCKILVFFTFVLTFLYSRVRTYIYGYLVVTYLFFNDAPFLVTYVFLKYLYIPSCFKSQTSGQFLFLATSLFQSHTYFYFLSYEYLLLVTYSYFFFQLRISFFQTRYQSRGYLPGAEECSIIVKKKKQGQRESHNNTGAYHCCQVPTRFSVQLAIFVVYFRLKKLLKNFSALLGYIGLRFPRPSEFQENLSDYWPNFRTAGNNDEKKREIER